MVGTVGSKLIVGGVGTLLAASLLLAMLIGGLSGPHPVPCGPQVAVNHSVDADAGYLLLEHAGGDLVDDSGRTVVTITDSETNRTATVVWLRRDANATIRPGDTLRIEGPAHAGTSRPSVPFEFTSGDQVRVIWQSPPDTTPPRESCDQSLVLEQFTLGAPTTTSNASANSLTALPVDVSAADH